MYSEFGISFGGPSLASAACASVGGLKDESRTDNLRRLGCSAVDRSGHFGLGVYITSTGRLLGDSLSRRRPNAWEVVVVVIRCSSIILLRLTPLEVCLNSLCCKAACARDTL